MFLLFFFFIGAPDFFECRCESAEFVLRCVRDQWSETESPVVSSPSPTAMPRDRTEEKRTMAKMCDWMYVTDPRFMGRSGPTTVRLDIMVSTVTFTTTRGVAGVDSPDTTRHA